MALENVVFFFLGRIPVRTDLGGFGEPGYTSRTNFLILAKIGSDSGIRVLLFSQSIAGNKVTLGIRLRRRHILLFTSLRIRDIRQVLKFLDLPRIRRVEEGLAHRLEGRRCVVRRELYMYGWQELVFDSGMV